MSEKWALATILLVFCVSVAYLAGATFGLPPPAVTSDPQHIWQIETHDGNRVFAHTLRVTSINLLQCETDAGRVRLDVCNVESIERVPRRWR